MAEATPQSAVEDSIFEYTSWDRKVDAAPPLFAGHPHLPSCSDGVARKPLAIDYLTEDFNARIATTDYQPRPHDGFWRRVLIYIDSLQLRLYHQINQTTGLRAGFASGLLMTVSSVFRRSDRG